MPQAVPSTSFWDKASPFLSFGAGGLAGGLFSSIFGNKNKQPDPLSQNLTSLVGDLRTHGNELYGAANERLGRSDKLFELPIEFWQHIASGDREAAMQFLAPAVKRVSDQYDAAKQQTAEFAPRGGGRNAALQDVGAQEQAQVSGQLFGTQPAAVQGLTDIAQFLGQEGISQLAASTGMSTSAVSALLNQLQLQQQEKQQKSQSLIGLGTGIGSILAGLI